MIRRRNNSLRFHRRYRLTKRAWLWAGMSLMIAVFIGTSVYVGMHFYDVLMQRRIEAKIGDMFETAKREHGPVIVPNDPDELEKATRGESEWAKSGAYCLKRKSAAKSFLPTYWK